MHSIKTKCMTAVRKCILRRGTRLWAMVLSVSILTGTLLAFPTMAAQEVAVPEVEPLPPADVQVCAFKVLQNNVQAITSATVTTTATYTGDLLTLHNVTMRADENEIVLCLQAGSTVQDAVTASGVTLGEQDMLTVSEDSFVTDGLVIAVTRVAYKEYQKTFKVAYTTETRYTSELRQGATKVQQQGKEGVRTVTYRDRMENGEVISTETVKDEVTTQPVKKIILKGTKVGNVVSEAPFDIALDSAAQPLNYKKKLTGQATAYTTDRGDSGAWTATGGRTQVGVVAVDPRVIPYGTKLWIVSADGKHVYGYVVAGDTGGAVRSGKILVDLYYDTYSECNSFGRRTMNVYILE